MQVGLVVFDRQHVIPSRVDDRAGQRTLAEQGVTGQHPQRRPEREQVVQVGLENVRFGALAVPDRVLMNAIAWAARSSRVSGARA